VQRLEAQRNAAQRSATPRHATQRNVPFSGDLMKPTFVASADTKFIAAALAKVRHGETITYEELDKAIGRSVRVYALSSLHTALRQQVSDGRVFEVEKNVGYRLLTDSEIVQTQFAKNSAHVRRATRKTVKRIKAAKFDALSGEEKIAHNTQISMLGALHQMTTPKAELVVQKEVQRRSAELPVGDVLALMTK
jgi:hypothetical protein